MKESLFTIFQRHPKWEEPDGSKYDEMRHAAAIYVESLLPLADRWERAVEFDVNQISTFEPAHTLFNKDRLELYGLAVKDFLLAVANALRSCGFEIRQLDRITQWKLGVQTKGAQIFPGLSRIDTSRLYEKMKKQGFRVHYFRELCSDNYTVLAWNEAKKEPHVPPSRPTLKTKLAEVRAKQLFECLKEIGFVDSKTRESEWLSIFNFKPFPKDFKPIVWTSKNARTGKPSKSSLLDFLTLMGVDGSTIRKCVNVLFCPYEQKKFGSNDFNKFFIKGKGREHHNILQEIITKVNS